MRRTLVAGLALLLTPLLAGTASAAPAGASWGFNETSGPVLDSVNGNTGSIGTGITRVAYPDGGRGLYFSGKGVVTVPDSPSLNPYNANVTLEVRVKPVTLDDRNLLQKGQYSAAGQQYKLELVGSSWNCAFKGSAGAASAGFGSNVRGTATKGVWQVVTCRKTATSVQLLVDGVVKATTNVAVGSIGTVGKPVTIGGKINCTHCDLYVGSMDRASVTIG